MTSGILFLVFLGVALVCAVLLLGVMLLDGLALGTKSLLFGVHQFAWHPVTVWRAWVALYGVRPTWRETVCIVIHDWGYWGCGDMDGEEGQAHPLFGERVAAWLFRDPAYARLVRHHSRKLAAKDAEKPSRLCWADKCSMLYDPTWFYLLRARATGEILEYRREAAVRDINEPDYMCADASDETWLIMTRAYLKRLSQRKVQETSLLNLGTAIVEGVVREAVVKPAVDAILADVFADGGYTGGAGKPQLFVVERGWWRCQRCSALFEAFGNPASFHECKAVEARR